MPLEQLPGMISLRAGKPAPETFPITSLSFTVRSPESTASRPVPDIPLKLEGPLLAEALQYNTTRGLASFIDWADGLQERSHGRVSGIEGWSTTVGSGSTDLLYKVRKTRSETVGNPDAHFV